MSPFDLHRRQWGKVAAVTLYAVLAAGAVAALVGTGTDPAGVVVLAVVAVAGLVVALAALLTRTATTARRLAADTRVVVDVNPSHRLDPVRAGELYLLAAAVNRLADRRQAAETEVQQQVEAARREMEAERNRLAALMAQLTVAVIVCNVEGRILLYNDAARAVVGQDAPLGLGRSVFGIVDRAVVAHVHDHLAAGSRSGPAVTTLHGERLLRVRVALVEEPGVSRASGFVLVLEDLTRQAQAADHRERVLRELTEATRASLGSIRAAVESVLEFPDSTAGERQRFLEIVRDESDRLGRRIEHWAAETPFLGAELLLTDMAGSDLLAVVSGDLGRAGVDASCSPPPEELWVKADSHALARALVHLLSRVRDGCGVQRVTLTLSASQRHARLDARWQGGVPTPEEFASWLDERLDGAGPTTAREVADRHGGEAWSGAAAGGTGYLRMLLPLALPAAPRAQPRVTLDLPSRPEFYDFDLFTAAAESEDWRERPLDALSFTVLDTETTGLDAAAGDRVVALGAVRVVNGRLLRQETFERLVDPQRPIPPASTAIHGVTEEMVRDAPTLAQVLPAFSRFAEGTVLVGHNISFDLQFLTAAAERGTPLRSQPVLDTLLLDAALHPEYDDHTLESIAARLGVSVMGRHTALGDALLTGEILVALLPALRARGIHTLGDALAASRETYQARVDESLYRR